MRGVRGSHADSVDLRLVRGLPVTSPAATWWSLGSELDLDDLIAAADSLVKRTRPLCTIEELASAGTAARGRRGAALCRRALPLVRAGCDSRRETQLRLVLVRAGLPEPEVNPVVLRTIDGRYFGDLVYSEHRVIVEYDGGHHRTDSRQFARDVTRLEHLAREGWSVVRVLKEHLADPDEVVRRVVLALRSRGWRG